MSANYAHQQKTQQYRSSGHREPAKQPPLPLWDLPVNPVFRFPKDIATQVTLSHDMRLIKDTDVAKGSWLAGAVDPKINERLAHEGTTLPANSMVYRGTEFARGSKITIAIPASQIYW